MPKFKFYIMRYIKTNGSLMILVLLSYIISIVITDVMSWFIQFNAFKRCCDLTTHVILLPNCSYFIVKKFLCYILAKCSCYIFIKVSLLS